MSDAKLLHIISTREASNFATDGDAVNGKKKEKMKRWKWNKFLCGWRRGKKLFAFNSLSTSHEGKLSVVNEAAGWGDSPGWQRRTKEAQRRWENFIKRSEQGEEKCQTSRKFPTRWNSGSIFEMTREKNALHHVREARATWEFHAISRRIQGIFLNHAMRNRDCNNLCELTQKSGRDAASASDSMRSSLSHKFTFQHPINFFLSFLHVCRRRLDLMLASSYCESQFLSSHTKLMPKQTQHESTHDDEGTWMKNGKSTKIPPFQHTKSSCYEEKGVINIWKNDESVENIFRIVLREESDHQKRHDAHIRSISMRLPHPHHHAWFIVYF